jgi:hypothetical protein
MFRPAFPRLSFVKIGSELIVSRDLLWSRSGRSRRVLKTSVELFSIMHPPHSSNVLIAEI